MLKITCPHCGDRAQAEFVYERTLDSVVPLDCEPDEAVERLFTRANPRGLDDEIWCHAHGCGSWMVIRRDRLSHATLSVNPLCPESLP